MDGIATISGDTFRRMTEPQTPLKSDPTAKFLMLDADGSGGLDSVELSTEAQKLSEMTGMPLNIDETIAIYDANGNGSLDQSEMKEMIRGVLGPPPEQTIFATGLEEKTGQTIDVLA